MKDNRKEGKNDKKREEKKKKEKKGKTINKGNNLILKGAKDMIFGGNLDH